MKEKGDLNNGYCFDCIRGCNCAYCDNIIDDEDDIDSVLVCKTCAKVYHSYDPVDEYITGCNFQHGPCCGKCMICGLMNARFPNKEERFCKKCWDDVFCPLCNEMLKVPTDIQSLDIDGDQCERALNESHAKKKLTVSCNVCHRFTHYICAKYINNFRSCCR
jgi:hypothetical protein